MIIQACRWKCVAVSLSISEKIWKFVQGFEEAGKNCFGVELSEFQEEIKGSKLLRKDKYRWAKKSSSFPHMNREEKYKAIRRFLTQKFQKDQKPRERDFYVYGEACISMAHKIFKLLEKNDAKLFASAIPRGAKKPHNFEFPDYLRKDHVFLQERFFNFLEIKKESGILVMDQTEKQNDKRFVKHLQNYYTRTYTGKRRTQWIVPYPLFVDSEMSPLIQTADLCIYCINWGYRLRSWGFSGPMRQEISDQFGGLCNKLQFQGEVYDEKENKNFKQYGIVYVPQPYESSNAKDGL